MGLKVLVSIRPSKIEGVGVFTEFSIAKGQIVCVYDSESTTTIPPCSKDMYPKGYLLRYAWRQDGTWYMRKDETKYINHSSDPNIGPVVNSHGERNMEKYIALRDIRAGEELLDNYEEYDDAWPEYSDKIKNN